jgi:monofunctional biosynthetic peptidoglycan transglycosylase
VSRRSIPGQIGAALASAAAVGFGFLAYAYLTLPDVRPLATTNPENTAFMELRDREAREKGEEPKRVQQWVPYRRISPSLKRAVLVAEDAAFWSHDGLDYEELKKAIELDWEKGQLVRGASTITQQLAKNLYLSPSRNPLRKLRELIIARRLEAELKKARILEIYLNVIEWGDGVYGVEAAARTYFGTSASQLGPAESALLAGAIVNPRLLSPSHPTARLLNRQRLILGRMNVVVPPPDVAAAHQDSPESPEAEAAGEPQPEDDKPEEETPATDADAPRAEGAPEEESQPEAPTEPQPPSDDPQAEPEASQGAGIIGRDAPR